MMILSAGVVLSFLVSIVTLEGLTCKEWLSIAAGVEIGSIDISHQDHVLLDVLIIKSERADRDRIELTAEEQGFLIRFSEKMSPDQFIQFLDTLGLIITNDNAKPFKFSPYPGVDPLDIEAQEMEDALLDRIKMEEAERRIEFEKKLRLLAFLGGGGGIAVGSVIAAFPYLIQPYTNGAQQGQNYVVLAREELAQEGFDPRGQEVAQLVAEFYRTGTAPQNFSIGNGNTANFKTRESFFGRSIFIYSVNDPEITQVMIQKQQDSTRGEVVLVSIYVKAGHVSQGVEWPTVINYTYDSEGNLIRME